VTRKKTAHRLSSDYKYQGWVGKSNFIRKDAEQVFNYRHKANNKSPWSIQSIEVSGIIAILTEFIEKLKN